MAGNAAPVASTVTRPIVVTNLPDPSTFLGPLLVALCPFPPDTYNGLVAQIRKSPTTWSGQYLAVAGRVFVMVVVGGSNITGSPFYPLFQVADPTIRSDSVCVIRGNATSGPVGSALALSFTCQDLSNGLWTSADGLGWTVPLPPFPSPFFPLRQFVHDR